MLLLNVFHPGPDEAETALIDPTAIEVIRTYDAYTQVITNRASVHVTDTAADIAKLRKLLACSGTNAFQRQFGLDKPTYVVCSIGWRRDGSGLILDVVDLDELTEAEPRQ